MNPSADEAWVIILASVLVLGSAIAIIGFIIICRRRRAMQSKLSGQALPTVTNGPKSINDWDEENYELEAKSQPDWASVGYDVGQHSQVSYHYNT